MAGLFAIVLATGPASKGRRIASMGSTAAWNAGRSAGRAASSRSRKRRKVAMCLCSSSTKRSRLRASPICAAPCSMKRMTPISSHSKTRHTESAVDHCTSAIVSGSSAIAPTSSPRPASMAGRA